MRKSLQVEITDLAHADEDHQVWWMSQQGGMALAVRFWEALAAVYVDLAETPGMGALYECDMPMLDGVRKISIKGFPNHLVFYRVEGHVLRILRVLHAARDLPKVIAWELNEAPATPYGAGMAATGKK